MGTQLKCYICDIEINRRLRKNVFEMKTQHSKKPIAELLKRFQNGVGTIQARDGSNNVNICILCDDCIDIINTYDEAYSLAEQVEKQLKGMIARTEKRYENANGVTKIHGNTTIIAHRKSKEPVVESHDVAADPFDSDEMQADQNSDFECVNDADVLNIPEPEEDIESEEEDIDSDDSFVWPKNSALKRKREKEKEKGKENVKKKAHIYKCIDCPADYRNKYEMQVILIKFVECSNTKAVPLCIDIKMNQMNHFEMWLIHCAVLCITEE